MEVCPTGAVSKRSEDGIVAVDRDKCNGCQDCFSACPYGVPQFGHDGIMQMCDFCTGIDMEPACAASCPTGALGYGTLDELLKLAKGKVVKSMGGTTKPSVVIAGELPLSSLVV
jgi:anaerobic dimethyl sulfoxide reductase subunit B (iron-sulfur subunit)